MKERFRLYRRNSVYYSQDNHTSKQESLHTKDKKAALRVLHNKDEAYQHPAMNLQIARAICWRMTLTTQALGGAIVDRVLFVEPILRVPSE